MIIMTDTAIIPYPAGATLVTAVEQNTEAVQSMLNGHWFSRRGTVADVRVVANSILHTSPDSGSFTVSYRVSFFYACDGIELGQGEQSKILFTIPSDGNQLVLTVEPDPERYDEL